MIVTLVLFKYFIHSIFYHFFMHFNLIAFKVDAY
jgi:hypothetical protein